ncbi:hypothetical protein ACIOHE_15770 [Streptomyces sp. NPDC087851]|uniref:hypothetical protein n=1 Tax=Streptomyces sp. NPDC087851 TaxID=3365810 RepID=UPI00383005D1
MPDLVTFREAARRVVAEGIAPSMTHQRISQLARQDPDFPSTRKIGRSTVADWASLRPYFTEHARKAAARDSRRRTAEVTDPNTEGEQPEG